MGEGKGRQGVGEGEARQGVGEGGGERGRNSNDCIEKR